jgi:hypothetical protein
MDVVVAVAQYITALMSYDANLVFAGRDNFLRQDSSTNYVVVDLVTSGIKGSGKEFNSDTEIQTITTRYVGSCQVLFYGVDARTNAQSFRNVSLSENAFTLQRSLGINLSRVSQVNNLKVADGKKYHSLYLTEFKVEYSTSDEIETLRLDEAQIEFITN